MEKKTLISNPEESAQANHKYLGIFGMFWLSFLILTMFTALKTFNIFGLEYSVAIIAYPITYIFSDIFTEVYGYRVSRKIVWTGFASIFLISLFAYLYATIPPSPSFADNDAFQLIFKAAPLVVLCQILSFFCGELTNSFILAKLKIFTKGKYAEFRFISSTFFGQIVDNTIAFAGIYLIVGFFTSDTLLPLIASSVLFCVAVELVMTPITRRVIAHIKQQEGLDTYDHGTNFNPFLFK